MASSSGPEEVHKFHDELRWCISQLEIGLQRQDPDSRQANETLKILKILRSPKAPLVKKRQAMRNALGDYRKKMKESEKKFLTGLKNSRFQTAGNNTAHSKSKFLRQSHSRTVDRDELGSHLSSLNLQQSQTVENPSEASNSNVYGNSFMEESFNTGGPSQGIILSSERSSSQIKNMDNCEVTLGTGEDSSFSNASPALLKGQVRECEAKSGQAHDKVGLHRNPDCHAQALSTNTTFKSSGHENSFHFVPSDNSFCFGFSNNDEIHMGKEGKEDSLELTETSAEEVPCFRQNGGDGISDSEKVKSNVFKYEKTDNSFAFNFS